MKTTEEFTYLRSVLPSNGEFTQDIERRRAAATRAFGMLRRSLWDMREVSFKVKIKIFNVVVLPMLLLGATASALTRTEVGRLDAFQMGMLRTIADDRWDEFFLNDDIRARLEQPPVSLKLRSSRMK